VRLLSSTGASCYWFPSTAVNSIFGALVKATRGARGTADPHQAVRGGSLLTSVHLGGRVPRPAPRTLLGSLMPNSARLEACGHVQLAVGPAEDAVAPLPLPAGSAGGDGARVGAADPSAGKAHGVLPVQAGGARLAGRPLRRLLELGHDPRPLVQASLLDRALRVSVVALTAPPPHIAGRARRRPARKSLSGLAAALPLWRTSPRVARSERAR
jgi:hypothetical protein